MLTGGMDRAEAEAAAHGLSHTKNLAKQLDEALELLQKLHADGKLPKDAITEARGLLFMSLKKMGIAVSTTDGHGFLIAKKSSGGWSAPLPVEIDGLGVGAVIGVTSQHTLISLTSDDDMLQFKKDTPTALKIGVDFAMNLGKHEPFGADAKASEHKAKTRSFTISKGLMLTLELEGVGAEVDRIDLALAYSKTTTAYEVLSGKVPPPAEFQRLYDVLAELEK